MKICSIEIIRNGFVKVLCSYIIMFYILDRNMCFFKNRVKWVILVFGIYIGFNWKGSGMWLLLIFFLCCNLNYWWFKCEIKKKLILLDWY